VQSFACVKDAIIFIESEAQKRDMIIAGGKVKRVKDAFTDLVPTKLAKSLRKRL